MWQKSLKWSIEHSMGHLKEINMQIYEADYN